MAVFLKKAFFLLYESVQKAGLFLALFFHFFYTNGKFSRFLVLRKPSSFKKCVDQAGIKFAQLQKVHKNLSIYWFHVASAGEMEQAIPVAQKLNERCGAFFFVTYYSPSTEPFLKNFPNLIGSAGLPIDLRDLYENIFSILPIKKIFFVRYDIWPSLLEICQRNHVEINLISATRLKTRGGFVGKISIFWNSNFYKKFSHIFAVSKEDVLFFEKFIPQDRIHLAGDTKWMRAYDRAHNQNKFKMDDRFTSFLKEKKDKFKRKNIVFGSPHKEEYDLALRLASLQAKFFLIYVPHDVSKKSCESLSKEFFSVGFHPVLYSEFHMKNQDQWDDCDLIIIDQVGFLADVYQFADAAIIGGGFDGQIHNILEASAHGTPVLIGPDFQRAFEVQTLVSEKAAISFESPNQLFQFLSQWVSLDEQVNDSALQLAHAKSAAVKLFQNIPDTSEVIFRNLEPQK